MARIRSIKPEFPQSESMGRVSRDARLLFVMLWPICDDHGRTRAASRMLASTLFPYDDDAKKLIDVWLDELEREGCIYRYEVAGSQYLEILNWLTHQRIDKPSKPQFPEPSEGLARIREGSWLERKGREGKGEEGSPAPAAPGKPKSRKTRVPEGFGISERVERWAKEKGHSRLPERLEHFVCAAKAKGYEYVDWDEAFMAAVRDDWAKLGTSKASLPGGGRRAL